MFFQSYKFNKFIAIFAFMTRKLITAAIAAFAFCAYSSAQTATSLFWKKDGIQIKEIASEKANQYSKVGHHGPAVENSHCALRIYFNDSGAIDVYSKSGHGMELEKYLWYPKEEQQAKEGAGCDEYRVGKTVGLGGIALWDGEKEVKLVATKGRTAQVGEVKGGKYVRMIAYGVAYKGEFVDISIKVTMKDKSRIATIEAEELSGKKVQFLTGVNYHEGEDIAFGTGHIAVWGVHPADVSATPGEIGAGMWFKARHFSQVEQTENMLQIISKPCSKISTQVIAASVKEDELNTKEKFFNYICK